MAFKPGTDPEVMKKNILELLEKGEIQEYRIDPPRKIDISSLGGTTPRYILGKEIEVRMYLKVNDEEYLEELFK